MRKSFALVIVLLVLAALPALAEIELGIGLTPTKGDSSSNGSSNGSSSNSPNFWDDAYKDIHLGWRTLGIVYFSGDFIVVPPYLAESMTSYWDSTNQTWIQGIYRPAVVSLYDVGFKLKLKAVSLSAQIGLNQFYLYKQAELDNFNPPQIGANLKVGAGLRLINFLGLEVSAVSIQPSFQDAIDVVKGVFASDSKIQKDAVDKLEKQIVPMIQVVMYL